MILHQIESLAAAGVTDIVLAVNYRPDIMAKALKKVCAPANINTLWMAKLAQLTNPSTKQNTM